jgi:hypothetical protein
MSEQDLTPDSEGVVDFTPERKQPRFRIDDDVFVGVRDVPTMTALQFAQGLNDVDLEDDDLSQETIDTMMTMLRMMLTTESSTLLIERLSDPDNPVGIQTFTRIIPWLMEQYGMRPTEPSSDSQDGSPNETPAGTTDSTGSLRVEVLTSSPSASIVA